MGGLWVAVVVLFLYLLPSLLITAAAADAPPEAQTDLRQQLSALAPGNLSPHLLGFLFPNLGTSIALILGSLAAGSEYGWGTFKMVLSQRPGRISVFAGKILALGALLLLFVVLAFVVGALSGLVVALSGGVSPGTPPLSELFGGLGAGTLILFLWAAFGFTLSTLFRSTALSVGLGLIYAFVIEAILSTLSPLSGSLRTLVRYLPGTNASALSTSFGGSAGTQGFEQGFLSPVQSILVVLLYIAAFLIISALVFWRRDVT
jgi:ABC-type transport system involved in multi-copper enzyme maturation permease subunit